MGILLALGSAFCFALFTFLGKLSVNKTKYPDAVTVLYQLIAGIVSLVFVFQDGMRFQDVSALSWILLLITTILYGLGNILSFRSSKVLDVSLTSIIGQMALIFAFFGSILVFRESITANKIFGVLFILTGNIIVLVGAKFSKLDTKMIMLRLLVCVMFAASNIIDGHNGKNFPLSFYIFMGYFGGGLIAYFGSRISISKLKDELKGNLKMQLIMGVISAFGYYMFLQAFNYAQKSIVIPITYVNTIITVILGIVILKETKSLWRKILAIIIVFLGSVLVNF